MILVTETKLLPDDQTYEFFEIIGYTSYRKDRGNVRGGGVIIFVCDNLTSKLEINDIWLRNESVVCRVIYGKKFTLVACIYCPPDSSLDINHQ